MEVFRERIMKLQVAYSVISRIILLFQLTDALGKRISLCRG
jgi:hypothetical protein